jgi:hypothetical protein
MHDMPDTDEADGLAERYWPEEYKWVIKTDLRQSLEAALQGTGAFSGIYQKYYQDFFSGFEPFIQRLAELVVIGSENGVDEILEEIHGAFRRNGPLPEKRLYAVYYWPQPFDEGLKNTLHREVFEEFGTHHTYQHIHEDHFNGRQSFDDFIDGLAWLVVAGAMNGADKAIGDIYRAFLFGAPLPHFRRRPRRVR